MILVAGATGQLGGLIVQQLIEQGRPVRALSRSSADPEKLDRLRTMGAELVVADLKDAQSLMQACAGVQTVISTATSIVSRQAGDNLETVDRDGNIALFDAARSCGAGQAIFVSFQPHEVDFPLQDAKRAVERHLRAGPLAYTILQPTWFMELWLGPALMPTHGFDFMTRKAKIAGDGDNALSWISIADVARFAVGAVDNPQARNQDFVLGGPESLSPNEVIRLLERGYGRPWSVEYTAQSVWRARIDEAPTPFDKSFAGLLTSFAAGYVADTRAALSAMVVETQGVSDYVARIVRHAER